MADYYLRHGEYPAYAATPTGASWPLDAQDGDGKASGLAVSATGYVDLTGVTAVAGNTLSIMGAVLTCVASGAGANQFNAASGATLATNIAAAINAATNTVNSGTSLATPQLRDLLYARVDPGKTTAVQIMTRPGSADLNYAANSNVAITQSGLSPAATLTQFSGGVSGAWGYLWNAPPAGTNSTATIWPSAKAINSYGVAFSAAAARPLVGPALTIADWVNVRAGNTVVSSGTGAGGGIDITAHLNFLLDDGTIWPGATGTFTWLMECGSGSASFAIRANNYTSLPQRPVTLASKAKDKLILQHSGSSGNTGYAALGAQPNAAVNLVNILFYDATVSASSSCKVGLYSGGGNIIRLQGCHFKFTRNLFYSIFITVNMSAAGRWDFADTTFEWTNLSNAASAVIDFAAVSAYQVCRMYNVEAIGAAPRAFSITSGQQFVTMTGKNLKGFSLSSTLAGYMGSSTDLREEVGFSFLQNVGTSRAMRLESLTSIVDWNPAGGYPTLSAQLSDNTAWSYRLLLSNLDNAARYGMCQELLSFTKTYEDAAASKTLSVEMYVPSAQAASIYNEHWGLEVSYTDSTGVQRNEYVDFSPNPLVGTTAMSASSAAWTANSYGSYSAKKLQITTANAIKQNTEIEVSLFQRRPMPAQVEIFVDPELGVV